MLLKLFLSLSEYCFIIIIIAIYFLKFNCDITQINKKQYKVWQGGFV